MSESIPDYVVTAWGERHQYSVANGHLGYRFGESDVSFIFALQPGGFSLRRRWQTHRYLRVGLILIAFALFTLGPIYAKEHSIAGLGAMLYVNLGMLTVGLVLVLRFRHIYRAHLLRTDKGDEILIYHDPDNAERVDAFISRLNGMA